MSRLWILYFGLIFSSLVQADFLEQKLSDISADSDIKVEFTDIWQADYLDKAVVTHGNLYFKPPNRLIKDVTSPESITYTVSGDSVKIQQNNSVKHIKLSENADLAMAINTIRLLLQGDRDGLEKMFLIQFRHSDTNVQSWLIELFPRPAFEDIKTKKITVTGVRDELREIKVEYNNNDTHITRIGPNE